MNKNEFDLYPLLSGRIGMNRIARRSELSFKTVIVQTSTKKVIEKRCDNVKAKKKGKRNRIEQSVMSQLSPPFLSQSGRQRPTIIEMNIILHFYIFSVFFFLLIFLQP